MSGIYKFRKISMVVSLLIANASWVHAMEPEDEDYDELTAAVILSLQSPTDEDQTDNDLTPEEWEIIKKQAFEAEQASRTIWTRDNHPEYRLRAENMPDSQKYGGNSNTPTQGLGDFIKGFERNPHRDLEWMKHAEQNKKQMEQRQFISAAPQPTQAELDALQALQQLKGLKKPKPAVRPLSQPPEKKEPVSVSTIADQFGGRGGFKKEKK